MNIWQWIQEYGAHAVQSRDTDGLKLVNTCWQALPLIQESPDQALALLESGRALAEQREERQWVLFFDHWRLQTLISHKQDYRMALPLAEQAAAEAKTSLVGELPQRICLQEDLIAAYLGVDPEGYANEITDAFDFMSAEMATECECRFCLHGLQTETAVARRHWTKARDEAMSYLRHSQHHPFHLSQALRHLCRISYQMQDWQSLRRWAGPDDEPPLQDAHPDSMTERRLWRAVSRRYAGQEEAARACFDSAEEEAAGSFTPSPGYFDALCAFHELNNDFDQALAVRDREEAFLNGKGQIYTEVQCLVKRCVLLKKAGRSFDAEIDRVRSVAQRLRNPLPLLAQLNRVLADQR